MTMTSTSFLITYTISSILCFIPAVVFHEVMHGFVAYKLGDPTAKRQGRLSLNPLKHIDPFGTVILPLCLLLMQGPIFGYAKPVPYNPAYFKDPRKGDLLVGLAGPAANFLLAIIGALLARLLFSLIPALGESISIMVYLKLFLSLFVLTNLYFMFFNLLPIPPLDGSSIFALIVPKKYLSKYYHVQRYALPIFLFAVVLLPYLFNFNPISIYLDWTANNVARLILPLSSM